MTDEIKNEISEEEALTKKKAERPARKKGRIFRKILYYTLLTVFVGVFVCCAVYIANYMVDSHEQGSAYDDLASIRDQYLNGSTDPQNTLPQQSQLPTLPNGNRDPQYILPELRDAYEKNNHLVGWITIPDTKINYPVVQSPEKPNYYLDHTFEKKWSSWGCIYARESCDVFRPSDNVVLYGHHMKDGSMFAQLDKYKKKDFWEEHQTFTFDTLYERHTYQVIAVFKTSANLGAGFSYHTFNDAGSKEEFDAFMEQVHKLQFSDTGVTAEYGDLLLTLSTCEYTLSNGRFVVVAKRIS
jgi:sortase B